MFDCPKSNGNKTVAFWVCHCLLVRKNHFYFLEKLDSACSGQEFSGS